MLAPEFCLTMGRALYPMEDTGQIGSSWNRALLRDSHFWIPLGVLFVGLLLLFEISNWSLS